MPEEVIHFYCEGCGGILTVPAEQAGYNVECGGCETKMPCPPASTAPDPEQAEEILEESPPEKKKRVIPIIIFSAVFLIGALATGYFYLRSDPLSSLTPSEHYEIPWVAKMARLPEPLIMRDWPELSRKYYKKILNQQSEVDEKKLIVVRMKNERLDFAIPSYMASKPGHEIFTCLSPVVGARMVGLDPEKLAGFDILRASKNWYDAKHGVYRHGPDNKSPVLHSGIYGYWSSVYGLALADLYPEDKDLALHAQTTADAFLKIAKGHGCPESPDFSTLGFNFETGKPDGRKEPMNTLGNAPMVAWALLIGNTLKDNPEMLECSRSAMKWYLENPGRYEGNHLMGPLTVARLNAEHGDSIDIQQAMKAWFGDCPNQKSGWWINSGIKHGGVTCDGIDGARWGLDTDKFHGFTMGTLCSPGWLVPVVRYDQRYAKSIARYALNAAVSSRLFQGYKLDWEHQDHKDWKDKWDQDCLFFYEALSPHEPSKETKFAPYATGDPIRCGWGCEKVERTDYLEQKKKWFSKSCNNLSLYMGNHIGFLGGICDLTDVDGILRWDCLKTDWFHPPAYPTWLYWNPYQTAKTVTIKLQTKADLYDSISRTFIARDADSGYKLTLQPDQAIVIVEVPANSKIEKDTKGLLAGGVVIDYQIQTAK